VSRALIVQLGDLPSALRRKVLKRAPVRGRGKRAGSDRNAPFLLLLSANGLPQPHQEFRFHDTRLWRFDFAWIEQRVALECDGGIWRQGRHTRGAGWLKDSEKLNCAATMGWRLLRCTPQQLALPELIATIRVALDYQP